MVAYPKRRACRAAATTSGSCSAEYRVDGARSTTPRTRSSSNGWRSGTRSLWRTERQHAGSGIRDDEGGTKPAARASRRIMRWTSSDAPWAEARRWNRSSTGAHGGWAGSTSTEAESAGSDRAPDRGDLDHARCLRLARPMHCMVVKETAKRQPDRWGPWAGAAHQVDGEHDLGACKPNGATDGAGSVAQPGDQDSVQGEHDGRLKAHGSARTAVWRPERQPACEPKGHGVGHTQINAEIGHDGDRLDGAAQRGSVVRRRVYRGRADAATRPTV